jgi:hypothetical protein
LPGSHEGIDVGLKVPPRTPRQSVTNNLFEIGEAYDAGKVITFPVDMAMSSMMAIVVVGIDIDSESAIVQDLRHRLAPTPS